MKIVVSALASALALMGCGGPEPEAAAAPPTSGGAEAEAPLDWAVLLPIQTEGILRIDLARVRRSPHHAALDPLLARALAELGEDGLRGAMSELIRRTDVVLFGVLPEDDDGVVILARGDYRPDEIARLDAAGEASSESEVVDVRGVSVWVDPGQDGPTLGQLRPDTLALTSSLETMDRLVARTGMTATGRRWPPTVRALVTDADLEEATLSFALGGRSNGSMGDMSFAGRADLDGPLDLLVRVRMDDPATASMAALMFQGMLQGIADRAGPEQAALADLARLGRFEAREEVVVGTLHAELETARGLVPALVELLTTLGAGDGADDAEGDPTPTEGAPPGPPVPLR